MQPSPSEEGREPYLAAKRRGVAEMSADVDKFREKAGPGLLREWGYGRLLGLRLQAEQVARNSVGSELAREEFLDWIRGEKFAEFCRLLNDLRDAMPDILAEKRSRLWSLAFRIFLAILPAAATALVSLFL